MTYTTQQMFGYIPNDYIAWASMGVFIVLGFVLLLVNRKFRPCLFMLTLVFCAWFEALGYALRVNAAHHPSILTFIFPTLFILLVPNAMALIGYMVVGKALNLSGLNVACLRPNWIAWTFFTSDVFSFALQGFGGGLLTSSNPATIDHGKKIILAGLAIQCLTLLLFLFVAINVHMRPKYLLRGNPNGNKLAWGLYLTTFLLFIRSIYRTIEYGSGKSSYVSTHEWPMYAFDTLPIMIAFVLYSTPALHFGRCLNELQAQCLQASKTVSDQGDEEAGFPAPVASASPYVVRVEAVQLAVPKQQATSPVANMA